jgi:hypothetical protein
MDEHALAIDVADLQGARLRDPKAGAVGSHQERPMFQRADGTQQPFHLATAQDVGQRSRNLRPRNRSDNFRTLKGHYEQEFQSRDVHPMRCRPYTSIAHKVKKELPHIIFAQLIGRAPKMRHEVTYSEQVLLSGRARKALEFQICFHSFANSAHGVLLGRPVVALYERITLIVALSRRCLSEAGLAHHPATAQRFSSVRLIPSTG